MNFLIAFLIALPVAALLICVAALAQRISERRAFREMATFPCPYCSRPIGLKPVLDGRDCSPFFGERWDVQGALVHCHPICRNVECEHCGNCVVIRFNRDGEQFGPRLSAENAEEIARIQAMPPEQLAEIKEWLLSAKIAAKPKVAPDCGGAK